MKRYVVDTNRLIVHSSSDSDLIISFQMEVRSGNVAKLVNRLSRDLSQLNKTTTAPSIDVNFRRSGFNTKI
ncbi:hypothetical protein WUBG_02082 [Wuchereria bancrofti]|uniref:Uncharacterized protein n=1 Tax=Wuchereria bancrofti TaxID=6293 RepID=J9BI19_WUCBA|nr:hypothetical protein WUBG_02082 [Wuchereria bancrofti]